MTIELCGSSPFLKSGGTGGGDNNGSDAGNVASLISTFERTDHGDQHHVTTAQNCMVDPRRKSTTSTLASGFPSPGRCSSLMNLNVPASSSAADVSQASIVGGLSSPNSGKRNYCDEKHNCKLASVTETSRVEPKVIATKSVGSWTNGFGGSVGRATGLSMTSNNERQGRKLMSYRQFVADWESRKSDDGGADKLGKTDAQATAALTSPGTGEHLKSIGNRTNWRGSGSALQLSRHDPMSAKSTDGTASRWKAEPQSEQKITKQEQNMWEFRITVPNYASDVGNTKSAATTTTQRDQIVSGSERKHDGSKDNGRQQLIGSNHDEKWPTAVNDDDINSLGTRRLPVSTISSTDWQRHGNEFGVGGERIGRTEIQEMWAVPYSSHAGSELLPPQSSSSSSPSVVTSSTFRLRTGSLQSDSTGFDSGVGRSETCASSTAGASQRIQSFTSFLTF
jgi:hypothetical protein